MHYAGVQNLSSSKSGKSKKELVQKLFPANAQLAHPPAFGACFFTRASLMAASNLPVQVFVL